MWLIVAWANSNKCCTQTETDKLSWKYPEAVGTWPAELEKKKRKRKHAKSKMEKDAVKYILCTAKQIKSGPCLH